MDAERIQRWTMPGVMFIVSFISFYICFIGDITNLFGASENLSFESIFALVATILTTPVIGLIISTIIMKFMEIIIGYKIHYGFPGEVHKQQILKDALALDKSGNLEMFDPNLGYWKKRVYIRKFYACYQALVRRRIQGEELKFLERRWTVFWTHLNNLSSIIIAFASIWLVKTNQFSTANSNVHQLATYLTIAIFIYSIAAIFQLIRVKLESIEIEHLFLLNPDLGAKVPTQVTT